MDTGGGGHISGSAASGSHSSGLSPNVASMTVMPPLNPLPGFGFGGAPAAHGGPVYPPQPLATTGCSPLYLPPPAGVVGPIPYPASVSSPPHSLVAAHCGSPYPAALHSPGGPSSGLYAPGSSASAVVANGSASKLLLGRHMCAICEDAASGKHYGVYRCVSLFNVKKVKGVYSCWFTGNPVSTVTCHMGSHSVTCHPTQVKASRLKPSQ